MSLIKKIDWLIVNTVDNNIVGRNIMDFLRRIGIAIVVRKILTIPYLKKTSKVPTKGMLAARRFFVENRVRMDRICGLLEDERSKVVYKAVVEFRQTHRWRDKAVVDSFKEQYFAKEIVKISDDEVFVDCGAYTGDTALLFKKKVGGRYKKIICFEPDHFNYKMLMAKKIKRLIAFNAGVWDKTDDLCFNERGATSSGISDKGDVQIKVRAIDDVKECHDATFIKMDIEGSELNALKGAEKTIRENKPKLAICIYHSNEDMIRIAEYIHELNPEYKLYIRQYSYEGYETVLYALS